MQMRDGSTHTPGGSTRYNVTAPKRSVSPGVLARTGGCAESDGLDHGSQGEARRGRQLLVRSSAQHFSTTRVARWYSRNGCSHYQNVFSLPPAVLTTRSLNSHYRSLFSLPNRVVSLSAPGISQRKTLAVVAHSL